MFNKVATSSNAGESSAYVVNSKTTYEISFTLKDDSSNSALTYNLMGISQQNTNEGYIFKSWTADEISNSFKTYTTTFTTPDADVLGDDIYLSFMILNPNGVSHTVWLDDVVIKEVGSLDTADLITFNDNGKVYYAYPDELTALPVGDNGTLGTEFIGWFDADGNEVTEVPTAGTVLNAKYPVLSELPLVKSTVTLPMDRYNG